MPVCVFVLLMAGCHGCRYFAGDLNTARLEQDRACRVVALFSSNKFGGDTLVTTRAMLEMKGMRRP